MIKLIFLIGAGSFVLMREGHYSHVFFYVFGSVVLGLLATCIAYFLVKTN